MAQEKPRLIACTTFVLAVAASTAVLMAMRQDGSVQPAIPRQPADTLLDAFRSNVVVAMSEGAGHGDQQWHALLRSLIRDKRLSEVVNDIVVEFGNARYQDVMDRFIVGEDVPDNVLRQVWQNTTVASALWDVPIYEEFFRTVREVNRSLPEARRIRVLLGDPPIDWDLVQSAQDVHKWAVDRDRHPAELVQREVLAKNRKALVIYGAAHLWRTTPPAPDQPDGQFPSIVRLLERAGAKVFTVVTAGTGDIKKLQANAASWPVPSAVMLRGTPLGLAKFRFFAPAPAAFRDTDPLRNLLMQEQFDALIYFGSAAPIASPPLPPALCADPGYMKMRTGRLALTTSVLPPGAPNPVEQLKQYCATVLPK
jgi:hypothetical protein